MEQPFIGSEALRSGALTPYRLRSRCVAIHPDVYVSVGTELNATSRARAAWLWSRRRGIVAGRSASALHGARWVDDRAPAQLLYEHRRPPKGVHTWSDRLADDEIQTIAKDIRRAESLTELGWTNVRVTVEDTPGGIIGRVSAAWQRRTCIQREDLAKN